MWWKCFLEHEEHEDHEKILVKKQENDEKVARKPLTSILYLFLLRVLRV